MSNDDEDTSETDWNLFDRVAHWAYEAISRIPKHGALMKALFGDPSTRWQGHDPVDLTNKALIALLELEIEDVTHKSQDMQAQMEKVIASAQIVDEASAEWDYIVANRGHIVFATKTGRISKLPVDVARAIAEGRTLDFDIEGQGDSIVLRRSGRIVAVVPLSLLRLLKGTPCWCHRGEGGEGRGHQ